MYLARDYGYHIKLTPNDFKLITGLLIIFCIVLSKGRFLAPKRRRNKSRPEEGRRGGAP
jgi:putative ABC transport system permease protein